MIWNMGTDQEVLVPVETYKNHIRPRICDLEVPCHQGMALSIESAAGVWGSAGLCEGTELCLCPRDLALAFVFRVQTFKTKGPGSCVVSGETCKVKIYLLSYEFKLVYFI